MKFKIQKDILYNALNAVVKAAATKSIQPVLSNVLMETIDNQIKFCATDLDISIEVRVSAVIEEEGSITLPVKKLSEIVSKLPNNEISFNLNTENNITEIKCGNSKFDIIGINSSEFPPISYPESEDLIEVELEPFLKAIKQVAFASSGYDTNNILSGVFFNINNNVLEMAATDGNRLTRVIKNIETENNKEYSVVIPSKTLTEFSKILLGTDDKNVFITIKNGQISFKLTDRFLVSRILEGQYPKYQQLIPSNYENYVLINRDNLISSLDRTSTMVNERTSIIKFIFKENNLNLLADTPNFGDCSDNVEIDYDKDELIIAFNYKYVLDALKVIDTDNIKMELNGPLSSVLIKPDSEEDYLNLIMPVQIR